jgi:pimeloyl-ACP methyl ester carboxylesterase
MLHGTPGCRLAKRYLEPAKVAAACVRLVTYDRPGYGRSARLRGRSVIDSVKAELRTHKLQGPTARSTVRFPRPTGRCLPSIHC